MIYSYRAKKGPKELVEGTIEALTVEDAIERLSEKGLLPIDVQEAKVQAVEAPSPRASTKPLPRSQPGRITLFGGIRSSEITVLSRQLASLLKAGVPILQGLWILSEQTQNPKLKKVLTHIQEEVNNGKSLSAIFSLYPKYFPPIYIAMIRTGEDSGTLDSALSRIAEYRRKQEEMRSRVLSAMAYPILMAITGAGTVIFMLTFVIPKLTKLFANLGQSLPAPTRILMTMSEFLKQPAFWGVIGILVVAFNLWVRLAPQMARAAWSAFSLKLPIIKGFVMKSEMARFSRTMELLLKSGVTVLRAIEITTPVLKNVILRAEFSKAYQSITGGGSLGKSLKESKIVPMFVSNLISIGEESGKLDDTMSEIADLYERETDEAIRVMTSLMEPLMILVMGGIVGFIVIAMMLPMFELNMAVK